MANATLKDIARIANVTAATVSLALNNKKGVSEGKAQEIKQIAVDLGYIRYQEEDVSGKTIHFVQILKPSQVWDDSYRIFIADYLEGLTMEASRHGLVIEAKTFETDNIASVLENLSSFNALGTVFLGAGLYPEDISILKRNRVQSVFIDVCYPGLGVDFIDMDNRECVYIIIEHLRKKGHTAIGLVQAEEQTPNFRMREEAFYSALNYYDLEWENDFHFTINKDQSIGQQQMHDQLTRLELRPTALFCVNDMIAYNCIHACQKLGIGIPEDIAVIGFDDLPASSIIRPQLTSINIPKKIIARRALQTLIDRIHYPSIKPSESVLINGVLVERESSG
ncbi:MAG: LacI family DNA-binding transcriptional regulator [Bacteroidetes bacterium]|nr:LacI family DNA-binding transcriptional regulator [Bacteroidota bacterium]